MKLAAAAVLAVAIGDVSFAAYPDRPIRLIVPYVAGGTSDILARILGDALTQELHQTVVVENKAGAGGNIGSDYVVRSKNDGYTLVLGSVGPQAINSSLYRSMPYDPVRDFTPVALFATVPTVLVVGPTAKVKTARELIALAKKEPGRLSYASAGVGTTQHLAGEMLKQKAGIDVVHIPYKGGGAAIADLVGGRTAFMFPNIPLVYGQIQAGTLRPLAVASPSRSPALPDVPTMAEATGIKGFDVSTWFGILGPADMPEDVVNLLNKAITKAVSTPEIREKLVRQGAEPLTKTPREFASFIAAEKDRWAAVVKQARIAPQ
ncbi:hypothetical protein AKI39_21580 [Bordetella sp. H567]|nr:hypothetical protein AKI39_21580 [Bordetella sp. H567]